MAVVDLALIADLSIKKFKLLPKTGKPTANEWTVLATIVQTFADECKVVALGCGTKCLGQNALRPGGLVLHDAHAEILARRAFIRYLHSELTKAIVTDNENKSIFELNEERTIFALKSGVEFQFFCTQTPCGDACINVAPPKPSTPFAVEHHNDEEAGSPLKRRKLEDAEAAVVETIFTGAKLIEDKATAVSDAMQQTIGAVRTKPGRGDRTLSVSCSDKLAKWCVLGVQGALLDVLIAQPIYFTSLNFACDDAEQSVLERAFYGRWQHKHFSHARYVQQRPTIRIGSMSTMTTTDGFEHVQTADKQPSPNGLIWCDIPLEQRPYEICVNGIRQGVTKKKLNTSQAALQISKWHLLQSYVRLLQICPNALLRRIGLESSNSNFDNITYTSYKHLATDYQDAWTYVKRDYFGQWTHKPIGLERFTIKGQT